MKINIAIVEDVPSEGKTLKGFIERYSAEKDISCKIEVFSSSTAFLSHFQNQYDVIFLDIELQKGENDGMETARIVRASDPNCTIVFVTNLGKYAIEGYSVKAMDFILKPINYEGFRFRFDNIIQKIGRQDNRTILIKSKGDFYKILIKDIFYVCIVNHLCYFYGTFTNGSSSDNLTCYETWMQLSAAQREIDSDRFVKCNLNYLVNVDRINKLSKDSITVGNTVLPLSRNRKKEVVQAYLSNFGKR